MNKIKIYFRGDWVYIAPPWLEVPENLNDSSENEYNNIGINLKSGTAYITNYCSVSASEMRTLVTMIEYAATICECNVTTKSVKDFPNLAKSSFPDADIYVVEESIDGRSKIATISDTHVAESP
jgi:hypothetical protein